MVFYAIIIFIITDTQVGYEFKDRNNKNLTQYLIPFKITIKLPKTDSGGRGYSDKYIEKLKKVLEE